jgi:hypothetical protein
MSPTREPTWTHSPTPVEASDDFDNESAYAPTGT